MKIILIRHAETNANALGLAQGSGSTEPLNEAGMAQAGALTALLSEEPIDAIYSSPALRAVQTVSGLAESTGITVQALPELAERNWGNWNMRIWKEVQEGLASLDPIERYTFAPRGGESEEELEQRLRKVADRFATLGSGSIVVVSHLSVLRVLLPLLLKRSLEEGMGYDLPNASVSVLEKGVDGFTALEIGSILHL